MKTNDSMRGTVDWVMYAVPYAATRDVVDGAVSRVVDGAVYGPVLWAVYWAVERAVDVAVGGVTAHPAIKGFLTSTVDSSVP